MSRICVITGKTKQRGKKVTLAWGVKYSSIRHRKVNLRSTTLMVNGEPVKATVSARGLKFIKSNKIPGIQTVAQSVAAAKLATEK